MIKEIILMRHDQPNLAHADKVSALDMKCWIEKYELSEIVDQPAPEVSAELAKAASVIVASNAPRALTSVRALGVQPTLVDELFCEADFPTLFPFGFPCESKRLERPISLVLVPPNLNL